MIVGLGVDITPVARMAGVLRRHGEAFLRRCFQPHEIRRQEDAEHIAGLFALKEAALKALGTGWGSGVHFRHLEICATPLGQPQLAFREKAWARAQALGVERVLCTVSHAGGLAVAVVILEGGAPRRAVAKSFSGDPP